MEPGRVSKDALPMGAYFYILLCADGSYYVGTAIASLEKRLAEHQAGTFDGYTARRRPVKLVFYQHLSGWRMRLPPSGRSKAGNGRRKKR